MKKYIAALLITALLCGILGVPAFSADTEVVLFASDFSGLEEGGKLATGSGENQWTQVITNAEKKLFVAGRADEGNPAVYIGCETDGQSGGPRITKRLDLQGYTKVTIEYTAKSDGVPLVLNFSGAGGTPNTALISTSNEKQVKCKAEIDLAKQTFSTYVDGKTLANNKALSLPDLSAAEVRFGVNAQPGKGAYVDNVVIRAVEGEVMHNAVAPSVAPGEKQMIFSDDFAGVSDGAKVATGAGEHQWTQIVTNAEKKLFVAGKTESGNSVLQIGCEADGQDGGPRITKRIDASAYTKLYIAYKAKSGGTPLTLNFSGNGGTPNTLLMSSSKTDWVQCTVEIDLVNATYSSFENGKVVVKDKALTLPDLVVAEVRFGVNAKSGETAYLDDVEIYAVQGEVTGPTQMPGAEFASDIPHQLQAPAGADVMWKTGLEDATHKTAYNSCLFDKASKDSPDILSVDGNPVLHFYGNDGKVHNAYVQFSALNADSFTLEYTFKPSKLTTTLSLYSDGKTNATFSLRADGRKIFADRWNHVKVDIDLAGKKATCTVNNQLITAVSLREVKNEKLTYFRMQSNVKDDEMLVDNFLLYTMGQRVFNSPLKGNRQIVWENVKPSAPISEKSNVKNLRAHPRLIVYDWDQVRKNIENSYEARMWYASLKAIADDALTQGPVEYALKDTGNILDAGRLLLNRSISLAFTYQMTGDRRYLEKCYNDIIYSGTWPDWSGFVASLSTTETVYGVACAYDWLYYDLTPQQRANIIDILKKHAMPDFIYNYEGVQTTTDFVVSPDGWMVSCNTNILAMAIAIADEEPVIAEYFLEKIPEICSIIPERFQPQGANASGMMYWVKVNEMVSIYADMIDNSFKPEFDMPAHWRISNAPGMDQVCEQPVYLTGPTGRFEYGDCSSGYCDAATYYICANRYNQPQYAAYQNKMSRKHNSWSALWTYGRVLAIANYDPANTTLSRNPFPFDKFYVADDGFNAISLRSSFESDNALFAAMQGGYAVESHMYPTLGTYVIDYHDQRFVSQLTGYSYAEAGAGTTKDQFYYKRAEGNNCLTMNPTAEADQSLQGFAKVIASGVSDNTAFGVMDMTSTNEDYVSAKRGMMLTDNRNRIIIQDEVVAKAPSEFYWFAHTDADVSIAKDGKSALLERGGERMLVRIIEGPADAYLTVTKRESLFESVGNIKAQSEGIKLMVHVKDKKEFNLSVEYVGLEAGEGIPEPWAYKPMMHWTADDNGKSATTEAYDATVLKIGSPNAIAHGDKTFVDPNNYDVVPFTENGRTLVPVRFISESFGATVGWDDATQSIGITMDDTVIQLQIGSNQMLVNGNAVQLDVPANTYNGRTLIPLRALVEALGKNVFWDDRGLIVISADPTPYSPETIDKMVAEMNISVYVDGKAMDWFEVSRENYTLTAPGSSAIPQISVATVGDEIISVTHASAIGESTVVQITGNGQTKTYTFLMQADTSDDMISTTTLANVSAVLYADRLPVQDNFIYVENLVDSTNWATYPPRGIVDGVINEEIVNRWAVNGTGWIQMDFGSVKNLHSMGFAGVYMTDRDYRFDVEVSTDGVNWTTIHEGGVKSTSDIMVIIPLGDVATRYVRMQAKGTTKSGWNTWAEVRFYENEAQQNADKAAWPQYFAKTLTGSVGEVSRVGLNTKDKNGKIMAVDKELVATYTVSDPTIASVDANGNVRMLKAGKTELVVSLQYYTATSTLRVPVVCK